MFKRMYFFTAESIPTLRQKRINNNKITFVSGFVHHNSFFSDPEKAKDYTIKKIINMDIGLNAGEIIMTGFSRV